MDEVVRPAKPSDGFLRLPLDAVLGVSLVHLVSGVDADESPRVLRCGSLTVITGYTEWNSVGLEVPLSLGWDWRLDKSHGGEVTCVRLGLPRTNVMLIDSHQLDFGWRRNLEVLGSVIDALPWVERVRQAVQASRLAVPGILVPPSPW